MFITFYGKGFIVPRRLQTSDNDISLVALVIQHGDILPTSVRVCAI